jgi:hypothetical protein
LSYTYSEIWQRAEYIYRTPLSRKSLIYQKEWPNKNTRVGCVQMASDDNPTLDPETIDFIFEDITDPDELDLRRYGMFKQISGRIHKTYDPGSLAILILGRVFDNIPYTIGCHAIGIDYHESQEYLGR